MRFEIIDQPERRVVGVVTRTSNAAESDPAQARLGALWRRARPHDPMVAVLTDYEIGRDGEFTEVVGREVDTGLEVTAPEVAVRVPAGSFARFVCEGSGPAAIVGGWRAVWAAEDAGELVRSYVCDVELWPGDSPPTILVGVGPG